MTPEQLKAVHDEIADIVEGIINAQEEVLPQVFLVYRGAESFAIPLPADIVVEGVSSPRGKQKLVLLIGALLRGDVNLALGVPDVIVQVFEGWSLMGNKSDDYDAERDGLIADMAADTPGRGECAFIVLTTLLGSAGGLIHIETDAHGQRRAVREPFTGQGLLGGRMVPESTRQH